MIKQLRRRAQRLANLRKQERIASSELAAALAGEAEQIHGNATVLAQQLGISKQYLCDVAKQRRSISDFLVAQIIKAAQ